VTLDSAEVASAILEMRDLLRLLAAPAVAERDKKAREDLKRIVGASQLKLKAVMLMDGSRNQAAIHKESSMQKSHLSTLVKQLGEANLLAGDVRQPKLAIILPANFFEGEK
jgi:hypothetical protein